ncbi:hypothetical protein NUW58_g3123 [Xylaria curta]|uniref:Uncharacterized protein n=1 Tax=Xylaria curta TaxID=42375 RepID=A0ACC1PCD8_9PEZI|nr:hypothetical protein NUW58_g3123 [Xylaria curta]
MDVSGVAVVIGAGSGIGRESALLFAERGARAVVFADQDVAAAEAASEESKGIATAKSYETLALHVDVRDRQSVKAVITAAKENFSRLDYAINCAGGRSGQRSVGPGAIVNIISLSAVLGTAQSATYVASKFAARGIIKCAALENRASGLRINEVCPGFTNTPMLQRGIQKQPEIGKVLNKSMPLGRVATPEEIANVVHFLASPGASFVNGQSIMVDSGVSVNILT